MNSSQMRLPNTASMPIPPEGETKSLELNVELWHACAGPLVSLPAVGSRVLYLPQGHIEQVAASTQKEIDAQIPAYPNLPSQLLCQLHDVILHADMETDEVYCQMTLQPIIGQEKDAFFVPEIGSQSRQPNVFFCKTLTASDTSTHGGFSIPRRAAEKVFPPLNFSQQPPAQELIARDLHETEWKFRHIYRGQPKRHLLTTGWSIFVSAKRLTAGDSVLFIRNEKDELLLGIRRATRPQSLLSSSVLSSESMHIGVLAAAAHAANTNSRFTVFYKPRASPSEFVIPYAKFEKAVYHMRVSVGMRFRMLFETDESSVRRHLGTITGISDLDPVRWPKSHWRSIKVGWDETTISEQHQRVSLWEIEPLTTFLVYPPTSDWKLKHSWPQPMGATFSNDLEIDNLKKRAMWMQLPNGSNGSNGIIPRGMGVNGPPLWSVYGASQENLPSKQETIQQQNPLLQADQMMMYMTQAQQQSQFLPPPHQLPQQTLLLKPQPMSHQQLPHQPHLQHPQLQQLPNQQQPTTAKSTTANNYQQLPDHQQKQLPHQQKLQRSHQQQQELPHQQQQSLPHQLPPQQLQLQQPTSSPTFQHHQTHPNKQPSPIHKQMLSDLHTPALQQTFQSIFSGFVSDTSPSLHGYDPGTVSLHGLDVPLHDSNVYLHGSISTITTPTISNHCSSGQQTQVINGTRTSPFSDPDFLSSGVVPPNSLYCYKDFPQEQDDMNLKCRKQSSFGGNVPLQQPMMTPSSLPSPPLMSHTDELQNVMIPNQSSVLSIEQPFGSNMYNSCALNDPHVMQALTSANAPVRTYTKVYKTGCVGRSLDITRFENYEELRSELGKLFGLEGQLEDAKSGWQLIFVDKENDWLLLGDDPWEVFMNNVRWIKILSPSEAFQMQDGVGLQQASNSSENGKTPHDARHPSSVVTSTCPLGY